MRLKLSDRETQIMELLASGLSPAGIAKKMFMEKVSIYGFIRGVYKKYGLKVEKGYDRRILAINKFRNDTMAEEYLELKETYDACYKEHLRVLEQNRKMQKSLNILIDKGLADVTAS